MNSRCQVDLIDMQSSPVGEFKLILVYQDYLTKFVLIRPLRTKTAVEVSNVLLDIFCLFGAPSILQSDNGREFANSVMAELCSKWSGLKMVHGKPRHSQSQGSVGRANQDIQNILMTWMSDEKSSKWSEGLKFVQLKKNSAYHDGIKRTAYKATFGSEIKVGLKSSYLPHEVTNHLTTEEDLQEVIDNFKENDLNDEQQSSELHTSENICMHFN
ncbi:unnamed protein product [Parnassius apollo]|uniref:(apollo) hypothetical protein n=1 Tax=Parnassius apollo TaxID=110799 RepID=A0A8S3XVK1_PARAO|nr:unnamed protein product [Parnassius apollo]